MKRSAIIALLLVVVLCSHGVATDDDPVLAKVGDKQIRLSDFDRITAYYGPERQQAIKGNPTSKMNLLKRIVQGMVIADLAKKEGFDRNPVIQEQLQINSNDFIALEYLKQKTSGTVEVSEKDMEEYYLVHRDEFKVSEQARVRHILVKADPKLPAEQRKERREKAEDILRRAKAGEDFATLASEYSDDSGSRAKGGDLGFFGKGAMVLEFEQASFSLKPGEVSGIVETRFGYHIIKLEEMKESSFEPIGAVKDKIREKLQSEFRSARVSDFIDRAFRNAGVELHFDVFLSGR